MLNTVCKYLFATCTSCSHKSHLGCLAEWVTNTEYGRVIDLSKLCCSQCKTPNPELDGVDDNLSYILCPSCREVKPYTKEINEFRLICDDCTPKTRKKCPKCSFIIEKNEDDIEVKCSNCAAKFCWLCLKSYSYGIDHLDRIHLNQHNSIKLEQKYENYMYIISRCRFDLDEVPPEFYTEELIISALRYDHSLIKNFKHNRDFCLKAVKCDGCSIIYIENPDRELCLEAVKQNANALKYIENQDKEICLIAVQQNPYSIKYVREQDEDIVFEAVNNNPESIEFVNSRYITACKNFIEKQKSILENVAKDGMLLKNVEYQTNEICRAAVRQNWRSLKYVKKQTQKICFDAIYRNTDAIELINDEFKPLCIELIKCLRGMIDSYNKKKNHIVEEPEVIDDEYDIVHTCSYNTHPDCVMMENNIIEYGKIINRNQLRCPGCKNINKTPDLDIPVDEIFDVMDKNPQSMYIVCPSCHKLKEYTGGDDDIQNQKEYRIVCSDCSSKKSKHCPTCNTLIENTKKNDYIKCSQCETIFCWICSDSHTLDQIWNHIIDEHGHTANKKWRYLNYLRLIYCRQIKFEKVPKEFYTKEIISIALQVDESTIKYLRQTPEMCLKAVKMNSRALEYIKVQTEELCLSAVKTDYYAIEYVDKKYKDVCQKYIEDKQKESSWKDIRRDCNEIKHVEYQDKEMCLFVVKKDGLLLRYVRNQDKEICMAAVKENGKALKYVKNQDKEICKAAVKNYEKAEEFVNEKFRRYV